MVTVLDQCQIMQNTTLATLQGMIDEYEASQTPVCYDTSLTSDGRLSTDRYNRDCAFYESNPIYCRYSDYFDDDDFNGNEDCCTCGGGTDDASLGYVPPQGECRNNDLDSNGM